MNFPPPDEQQPRNSTFQRLNKLANTRLLKPFISGQQLIDLQSLESQDHRKMLKNERMVHILEDRAHKAMENIRRRKKQVEEEPQDKVQTEKISKKLASELEVPRKPMLKSLASLQLPFESNLGVSKESHKKSTNAALQKIDSFEIEGGVMGNTREISENIEKIQLPSLQNIQVPSSKELEDLYDIRKSTMIKVSTLIEGETDNDKTQELIKENENKQFRRGFSYSDFESGGDNKRRVTFEKQYEDVWKGKIDFVGRIGKIAGKCCDFSLIKNKLESSFVDVVITSEKNREIDVVLQRKKTIILPGSFVKKFMDMTMAILCLYVLFSTPVYIAFYKESDYLSTVNIVFEIIFCTFFLIVLFIIIFCVNYYYYYY